MDQVQPGKSRIYSPDLIIQFFTRMNKSKHNPDVTAKTYSEVRRDDKGVHEVIHSCTNKRTKEIGRTSLPISLQKSHHR